MVAMVESAMPIEHCAPLAVGVAVVELISGFGLLEE
jgi:hypothetical protein